ncbi:helicase-related protein [Anaerobacillus sp. MEB173]|uniref:helicase-related protein n=1 Tax=Anaerobacillus sp. MEB173 TaxID=3383345 RepID=UPI003F911116
MDKITAVYAQAIEHTKRKVYEDIDSYLENKDTLQTFDQYLNDRAQYIEQIWVNVWLNKVTNDVPKNEKKSFLRRQDYEVEGVDRKLINRLFRNEMRAYRPFDVEGWLNEEFSGEEDKWSQRYEKARTSFFKREEERIEAEKKRNVQLVIHNASQKVIDQDRHLLFLSVRSKVANQLIYDLNNNKKYQYTDIYKIEEKLIEEGSFDAGDYVKVSQFFEELTGAVHKTYEWGQRYFVYEMYYEKYEQLIHTFLHEQITESVLATISSEVIEQYEQACGTRLTGEILKEMISYEIDDIADAFFYRIQDEYLTDLIALCEIPFDAKIHEEIYRRDIENRERRKAEEQAEIERKKAEEERMLDDIFGREYSPSIGRNIRYVLHIGETNTGKTHHALERMKKANSGLYLAPLRLLALEVYDKLNSDGIACGLKTGEEEKDLETATHFSCTVEMFYEKDFYDVIVIDEAQMIADKDRGFSWYKAITKANAKEVHIIGSLNSENMILQLLGDSDIEIREYHRDIPLEVESKEFSIKQTQKGDALVCFSRRRVLETASKLQNDGHSVSMIYGSMPPETRKKQMKQFINGETTVVVSTDAIGMGLNLPIRRIVFLENEKFDGTRRRRLTSQEIKQIAGRAGRKGIYNVGKVAFTKDIKLMKRLLNQVDEPVHTFAIAPTNAVFERYQKYYRDLGTFFELWHKFESPKGTKKATLSEERELYNLIRDTEIEARISMMDLYGFLHLPFSTKEPELIKQWRDTMVAIVRGKVLPEPEVIRESLEDLELSYKAIGLHLLFLYRLDRRTEAIYWERLREKLSDEIHELLKTDVGNFTKKCKHCEKSLPWDYRYSICDRCYYMRHRRKQYAHYDDD